MTRAISPGFAALVAALTVVCGGGGSPTPTPSPTSAADTATAEPVPPTAEPTPPPPVVVYVSPGSTGNTVHRVTVTPLSLDEEELPFVVPFAEMSLSPTGFQLAYAKPNVESGVILVDVVHATQQDVSDAAVSQAAPFWSIDGEHVAARAPDGERMVVWWRNTASGNNAETDLGAVVAVDLRWLPDAQGFSYIAGNEAGFLEIGGAYQRITADERYEAREVAFANDGTRAAVVRVRRPATPEPTVESDLTGTPAATETPRAGTATPTPVNAPSPPGEPANPWSIDIVSRDGRLLAGVAAGFTEVSKLRWIPALDGILAFIGTSPQGVTGLWMLQPGTIPVLVYEGRVDDATWSHDGEYVALVADGGPCGRTCPRGYLRVVELETGVVFTSDRGRVLGAPAWERPLSGP